MLEWQLEPGSVQGGSVQCDNRLTFAKQNDQGDRNRTADIYNNITCYKFGQLGNYSGSCPFKEDGQEKLKDKESSLDNTIQGINRATTGISSMQVDHEADESNGETVTTPIPKTKTTTTPIQIQARDFTKSLTT